MTSLRKKLLTAFLALFAAIGLGLGLLFLPASANADTSPVLDSKYYNIEGTVFKGLKDEAFSQIGRHGFSIALPDTVTEIAAGNENTGAAPSANKLFSNAQYNVTEYLTGVQFGNAAITKIGYRAFVGCSSLKEIDLSGLTSLTSLGEEAFRECTSLTSVTLPQSVTAVPDYLFRGCTNLETVTFNGTVTSIGISAFANCGKLTLTLPETLTEIGAAAFYQCNSLINVTVPDTVSKIGANAFEGCVNLTGVTLPQNITAIPDSLFRNCSSLTGFDIPDTVTKIGADALRNCIALTQITVPSGVEEIGLNAFYGLDNVTRINYYAVNASAEAAPFAMSESAYGRSQGVKVYIGGGASISTVKMLPQRLFAGHKAITSVDFANVTLNGVQGFGANVFNGCTSLEEVNFVTACNISVINDGAFDGCTSLHSVKDIEHIGLGTISAKAFNNCRSLYRIVIGTNVTAIGTDAFFGCERLIEVQNLSGITIEAGKENANDGKVAVNAKYVYGADGHTRIGNNSNGYVFYADLNKAEVLLIGYTGEGGALTLPAAYNISGTALTYDIYKYAFKGNTDITSIGFYEINITSNAKIIGDSAFEGCTSLVTADLPAKLMSVGTNLFQGCTSLSSVNFHSNTSLSTISDNMFRNCGELRTIEIPKNVQFINTYAFGGCAKLGSVTFAGNDVRAIRGHAFDGCSMLVAIKIPATVTTVETCCFQNCTNLKFVYLPDDAEYKTEVFDNCSDELILISANLEKYEADKIKDNIKSLDDEERLTYIVPLTLIYDDGCESHIINKLYNMPGDFSQNATTLSWSTSGRMPIQGGHDNTQLYVESVWFKELTFDTEVGVSDLTQMLAADDVQNITLYARYFTQPNLTAPNAIAYEVGKEYSIKDILTQVIKENGVAVSEERADELIRTFSFSVVSHTLVNGNPDDWSWEAGKVITDAGTYMLSVTLPTDGSYGGWASNFTLEFTINAGEVYIDDLLVWKALAPDIELDNKDNLLTKTLYFYNGTHTPYLEELEQQSPTEEKPIPTETVDVSNSYTVYTGEPITIRMEWDNERHNYGEIGNYSGKYSEIDPGTYTVSAIIVPDNNYIFNYRTDTKTLAKLNTLGVSFDKTNDGRIIVTKKWYIVISDVNQLLSADADGGLFDIPAELNYGDGAPSRPTLSKIPTQASEKLTFTLSFTDTANNVISFNDGNKISITEYERYFNTSMPAGEYTAKFFIAEGVDENGKVVTGDPEGKKFVFTVRELSVTKNDRNMVRDMLSDGAESHEDVVKNPSLVFKGSDALVMLNRTYSQNTPHSNLVWSDYKNYYTPFEIKYRVVRIGGENSDENYYKEDEYKNGGAATVKPQAIGSYNIYYIIDAPNYGESVSGSYRFDITLTLRPVLPGFDYDGNNVLNSVIRSLERTMGLEYFDIYTMLDYTSLADNDSLKRETISASDALRIKNMAAWGRNDAYTEIGTHQVFLRIKEGYSSYVKWGSETTDGYLYLPIEILASANSLSVTEWQFGRFDVSVNVPKLMVSYGEGTQYSFVLRPKGGNSGDAYLYYSDASINANVPEGRTLKDAPVGEYLLSAYATLGGDTKFEITDFAVTVHKISIDFAKEPYLGGWTYGQIDKDTDIDSQIRNAITLGAGIDAAVKNEISFRYITAANYEAGRTSVANISALTKDGYVPSGDYYVILTRAADGNYEALNYAIKFSVLKAPNYWVTTPEDKEVKSISVDDLLQLFRTGYGTDKNVKIELRTKDGEWRDVTDYAPTGQVNDGEYEMRITVTGENISELSETVKLKVDSTLEVAATETGGGSVRDDGISNGALIALIVVMAVIAAAAIAGGVLLVVFGNKKANAEYIKTVKSEMKRR